MLFRKRTGHKCRGTEQSCPTEKATERLSLILCGHVGLCHKTVLTLALHRWDLSSVHSTQCCFRSFEFHFPSQQLGRTRREPAFPGVHLGDLPLGEGGRCQTTERAPGVGQARLLGVGFVFSLPYCQLQTFHIAQKPAAAPASNHCSYG